MRPLVKRGEIWIARIPEGVGSEQSGSRPVIILQNDTGNRHSPTTIVACLTKYKDKANIPTHVVLNDPDNYTRLLPSIALLEQLYTIDKNRLVDYLEDVEPEDMRRIDNALKISLGVSTCVSVH